MGDGQLRHRDQALPSSDADRFSTSQRLSALLVGSIGTLVLGLQPVLLGALLSEGRASFDQVALIATIEMLAIGVGSALLALVMGARHMRIKAVALICLTALTYAATAFTASATGLIVVRGVSGLFEGGLIAVAVELIARTRQPGRNGGWFVVMQTLVQSVLAALLALIVVPKAGSFGGFLTLAGVSLLGLAATPLLADDYGPLNADKTGLAPRC
jgi:DHA1 family inner membrane transport protein